MASLRHGKGCAIAAMGITGDEGGVRKRGWVQSVIKRVLESGDGCNGNLW